MSLAIAMEFETLIWLILACAFLGGVGMACLSFHFCGKGGLWRHACDGAPSSGANAGTNLLEVVQIHDWTVEGLKALWQHFKLGPVRSLKKSDLEVGLTSHMDSHGIGLLITRGSKPRQHPE